MNILRHSSENPARKLRAPLLIAMIAGLVSCQVRPNPPEIRENLFPKLGDLPFPDYGLNTQRANNPADDEPFSVEISQQDSTVPPLHAIDQEFLDEVIPGATMLENGGISFPDESLTSAPQVTRENPISGLARTIEAEIPNQLALRNLENIAKLFTSLYQKTYKKNPENVTAQLVALKRTDVGIHFISVHYTEDGVSKTLPLHLEYSSFEVTTADTKESRIMSADEYAQLIQSEIRDLYINSYRFHFLARSKIRELARLENLGETHEDTIPEGAFESLLPGLGYNAGGIYPISEDGTRNGLRLTDTLKPATGVYRIVEIRQAR